MNTKLKVINLAGMCNFLGNYFIGAGILTMMFASVNYMHNFDKILKEAKKELVHNHAVFTAEEFKEIEAKSINKAKQDLALIFFGMFGKDLHANRPWAERAISDYKNIFSDTQKLVKNLFNYKK